MRLDEMRQNALNQHGTGQAPFRHETEQPGFWRSRYAIGLIVMGTIALYFLLSEHRAHFIHALPYLLLLACPLMHVFMHHGHGGHAGGHHADERDSNKPGAMQAPKSGDQP